MKCLKQNHQNSLIVCICLNENCHKDYLSCQYCLQFLHSNHKNCCKRFRSLTQTIKQKQKELHQLSLTGLNQQQHQKKLVELYQIILNKNYEQLNQHMKHLRNLFSQNQQQKQNDQYIHSINEKQNLEEICNTPKSNQFNNFIEQIKIQTINSTMKETDQCLLLKEAHKLYSQQDFKKALRYFNKALKLNVKTASLFFMIGKTLIKLNRFKKAITQINKAIKLSSNNSAKSQYLLSLASALFKLRQNKKSLKIINIAMELKPQSAELYFSKSLILKQLNQQEEAIECLKQSTQQNPQYHNAWCLQGNILLQQNKYEQALECFNKVIEINPSFSYAYFQKCFALFKQMKYYDSLNQIDICIQMKPNVKRYQNVKTIILSKLNRISEARYTSLNASGFIKFIKSKR
ncbi:unnamed protein product [Paramecium primaurelia]|uniref:Tetratricopeptide repeat protein n=1 Tax=Paramecium primaurelia TaxID=5886 RepID=A0A8S1L195_PARPR|nr:unnamed protein product [Paramecium primaurelia]